ncbi:DUF4145 domain-containing protein [Micromonospora sp. NPDC003816]|uniref:DUF4145 domain-containing protein n=1 Tax=Micromonospora sp. NPDC003816 TaxID=3364224 RepID=UPI0036B0704B
MGAFTCAACRRITLAHLTLRHPPYEYEEGLSGREVYELLGLHNDQLHWMPAYAAGKRFPDVPETLADTAGEAHRAMQTKCYRAAVLLARSVIEATAKEKQIAAGSLNAKIDAMADSGLIRRHIQEAAHEIRHLGNEMAHGDFTIPVAVEDAELVLTLMDEVLLEVFQSPARVAYAKAKRLARIEPAPETSGNGGVHE